MYSSRSHPLTGANAAQAITDFGTNGEVTVRLVSQFPGVDGRGTQLIFEQRNFGGPANPVVVVNFDDYPRIRIDGDRKPTKVKLFPERRRKAVLDLKRSRSVSTIEIQLIRGERGKGMPLGLSEVEVQREEKGRR